MNWWFSQLDSTGKPAKGCGTAGCIAGWALLLGSKKKGLTLKHASGLTVLWNIKEKAQRLLGLTSLQSTLLFIEEKWPAEFSRDKDGHYLDHKSALSAAKLAAKRIDVFIKSKGEI